MFQRKSLDGATLDNLHRLDDNIEKVLEDASVPDGLLRIDYDTGLVDVFVTKSKIQSMKLGRLLKKSGYKDKDIIKATSKLSALMNIYKGTKLEFTEDGQDAVDIYNHGPRSCMSGSESVRVYDSVDVAVAYARLNGEVVARSVVCINEDLGLRYSSVYGDIELLRGLLNNAGFESGSLSGCTLDRIEEDGRIVCPYLDCGTRANVEQGRLSLSNYGDYDTCSTDGFLRMFNCGCCGYELTSDEVCYSEDEEYCQDCHDDKFVLIDGEYHSKEGDNVVEYDGEWYLTDECVYSEHDDEYIPIDLCIHVKYSNDYAKESDVVEAITTLDLGKMTCIKDDCTMVFDKWVHDDILDEYKQINLEF